MTTMRGSAVVGVDGYDVYEIAHAMKLHYTSNYDAVKYKFKSRVNMNSFLKRNDRYTYTKLGRKCQTKNDVIQYFVAYYALGGEGSWIGDIVNEGEQYYTEWLRVAQSLNYTFTNDMRTLYNNNNNFNYHLKSQGEIPNIIQLMISERISLLTVLIVDACTGFIQKEDKNVNDRIFWPTIYNRLTKTKSFVSFADTQKYIDIIKKTFN